MTPIRTRSARALLATAALLVALAGCTSDGSDGADADSSTTTAAAAGSGAADALQERIADLPAADEVEGPITGGRYGIAYLAMPEGWDEEFGYTEEEYFLRGTAAAYEADGELGTDGTWSATRTDDTADYAIRTVVRRPADPAEFNGTLVVEWLNVSAGRESDPDFGFLADELLSEGYAYASVSAQQMGVEPGGLGIPVPGVIPEALQPLKEWDPERYGELSHPGDQYSYDIYSQAVRTLLDPADDAPLGGLAAERVIAAGESQSAFRLTTYANAIQPVTHLFDGILIHSRGNSSADLNATDAGKPAAVVHIRSDLDVPVFQFETETDLELLGFVRARQDDTDHLVTWETAGTAHADQSTLDYAVEAGKRWTDSGVDLAASCGTINDGPQEPLVQTALRHLEAWIVDGTAPPSSPRLETEEPTDGAIVRDDDGIALGGIRTPTVDAPIAVMTGTNTTPSVICSLFGSNEPFTPEQLVERYPGDTDGYVSEVQASADAAVQDGFLLPRHADAMVEAAQQVEIG
ncbi:MAG: hypothetical protein KDB04_17125 [Acidimicrobiales bacterium]|nr:hypothetical protein [Acidimicrobiales bacterium]HRW36405.1 alpha/beta hydrolase domain-containing protein [Aquihabitans sp.]